MFSNQRFAAIATRWLHPVLNAQPKIKNRALRVGYFSIFTALACLSFGPVFLYYGMIVAFWGTVVAALGCLTSILLLRLIRTPTPSAQAMILGAFIALFLVTVSSGALFSQAVFWSCMIVMSAAALAGFTTAGVYFTLCTTMLIGFYVMEVHGWQPESSVSPQAYMTLALMYPLGLLTVLSLMALSYQLTHDRTTSSLEKAVEDTRNAMSKLEQSQYQLKQFNYITSHDLQEPLRSIRNFAGLLKENGLSDEAKEQYLEIIISSSQRMSELIKDILYYSLLDNEREMSTIDCNLLMDEIRNDLSQMIAESDAKIALSPLPSVYGNRTQIRLLFQNLLSNAMKFRQQNTTPEIKIEGFRESTTSHFSVSDNGIGIDQGHQSRIFDVFQRLHTPEIYSGTGVGLALVKKVIDAHQGTIKVQSVLQKGSTFHFTLPANGQ